MQAMVTSLASPRFQYRLVERVPDLDLVGVVHAEPTEHRAADRFDAVTFVDDPQPEAVIAPVFQIALEISGRPRLVTHPAEMLHHAGVQMHPAHFAEVAWPEPLGAKAGGREAIKGGHGYRTLALP